MWPEHDYFRNVACSIQLEKGNMPQNNLFYLNQGLLLYKGCKKLFYDDYFILSQVLERSNPPSDIKNHIFDECEVLLYRPKQDIATGIFKGVYKTIGDIFVRGDPHEFFLDYVYSKKNSKVLPSFKKRIIPNSFGGTLFINKKVRYESCALSTGRSNVYLFLPSTTERTGKINRYFSSVKLLPMDVSEESFNIKKMGDFF